MDKIADRLYALAPADFTAERDREATLAKKAGQAALAKELKALRKPSQSAWLLNLMVRQNKSELAQLLELGTALREAQEALAADQLRTISAQRRAAINALSQEARSLAEKLGHPVSDAALAEVAATLDAALGDAAVAEELRSGRLTRALHYSGFGANPTREAPAANQQKLDAARDALARAEKHRDQARTRVDRDLEAETEADDAAARLEKELRAAHRAQEQAAEAVVASRADFDRAEVDFQEARKSLLALEKAS